MQREIKFRGKRVDRENWVYGDLIHGVGYKKGMLFILPVVENLGYIPDCDPLDGCKVLPGSVGQFTGLKDKEGKDIYEGDICRVLYSDWLSKPKEDSRTLDQYLWDKASNLLVHYDNYGFYFADKVDAYSQPMEVGSYGFILIIGNITDNSELLNN